jgi:CRISPR/Cas system CMR-associated protein Cmr5 small subunit
VRDLELWKKGEYIRDKISIPDWSYDEAGHIKEKRNRIYTLPYGFKYINVSNDGEEEVAAPASTAGIQTADNTQDTLNLTTSNKWILLDGSTEDAVQFGHLLKTVPTTTSTQSLSDEISQTVTFKVYDDSFDEAGHHNGRDTKTITMPFGYGKIKGDNGNTAATATYDELNVVSGDDWINTEVSQDTVTITHTGPVVTAVETKSNIENPSFGSTFEIEDWYFDSKGHMHTSGKTHTVQFPKGSIEHPTITSNTSEVITSLSFVPESGKISYQKDNSSTLKLTADYTNNGIGAGNIAGGDTINTAFAKLEKQVIQEVSERDTAIKTAIANLVDSAPENINTLGEIVAWLDNDGDEKIDIIKDIASNTSKIDEEIGRATAAEQELQERIEALGTAAKENKEYFATAAQGSTADTTAATIATYGDIVTYDAEDFVSKAEYDALLSDYNELRELVEKLNNQINPPQEPNEGGETI